MAAHQKRLATPAVEKASPARAAATERDAITIRFAGDAGDGMQLVGAQFTNTSAQQGNYVCTLPDLPAEIRAPAGTLPGVAGFQVQFSTRAIHTPGDRLDALIAMNPAALRANLPDLEANGLLIVNADMFIQEELDKTGYAVNPLGDNFLNGYRLLAAPMNQLNREAVARVNLSPREAERCKSFFALGLAYWLFERSPEPTLRWIRETYAKNPAMIEAGTRTLKAGYQFGEAHSALPVQRVAKVEMAAGRYRQVSGAESLCLGMLAAAQQANRNLVFAGFPLTPASELLHQLTEWNQPNAKVIQAEDDLAALNLALGASFGGAIGVTATTGPGMSLQSEALGLAVISELPCVVIDVQRAGPSTGMPSRTEQADLLQALDGRHGECPLIVLAMATPGDGFASMLEAVRLATRYMTPVVVLADAFLAGAAETWRVPSLDELPAIEIREAVSSSGAFLPYQRDDQLARPWATPGTPGLEHRTGGLEKEADTGNVSYDPLNHELMVQTRARKIALAADEIAPLTVQGPPSGDLLVIGWGSTYGAIAAAVARCQRKGRSIASAHLRHLNPLPRNTGDVLKGFHRVLVPELNSGQLCKLLRSTYLIDAVSMGKVQGRPFLISEIEARIEEMLR
jgi:2-oxoglutarate ferredoxin oxidoreductase subunit alpha